MRTSVKPIDFEETGQQGLESDGASVSFVCAPWLLFWLAALVACAAAIIFLKLGMDPAIVALAVGVFCLQGLIVDLVGIRVDAQSVNAPYRPWPNFPVAVLGRRAVQLDRIERIVVKDSRVFANAAILRTRTQENLGLYFTTRRKRREFYFLISELRPSTTVVKTK